MKPIYYPDHDERYKHIPPRLRKEYPDEVIVGGFTIKRVKNLNELTEEDQRRYTTDLIRLAAKDVPLSRATPYH